MSMIKKDWMPPELIPPGEDWKYTFSIDITPELREAHPTLQSIWLWEQNKLPVLRGSLIPTGTTLK